MVGDHPVQSEKEPDTALNQNKEDFQSKAK